MRAAEPRKEPFVSATSTTSVLFLLLSRMYAISVVGWLVADVTCMGALRHSHHLVFLPWAVFNKTIEAVSRNMILLDKEALTPHVPALRRCRMASSSPGPSPH
jgi:hypothetical protein